jgi:hypothetical protein
MAFLVLACRPTKVRNVSIDDLESWSNSFADSQSFRQYLRSWWKIVVVFLLRENEEGQGRRARDVLLRKSCNFMYGNNRIPSSVLKKVRSTSNTGQHSRTLCYVRFQFCE